MSGPIFNHVSSHLLNLIKRITVLVHEINKR